MTMKSTETVREKQKRTLTSQEVNSNINMGYERNVVRDTTRHSNGYLSHAWKIFNTVFRKRSNAQRPWT